MKKLFKVFIWIVAIIVVIFLILVGVGIYFNSNDDLAVSHQQALKYAESNSKESCLRKMAQRLSKCDAALCLKEGYFGPICLVNAQGDKANFCKDKPTSTKDFSSGTWLKHCSDNSLDKQKCEMLFMAFSAYCRNEFDQ